MRLATSTRSLHARTCARLHKCKVAIESRGAMIDLHGCMRLEAPGYCVDECLSRENEEISLSFRYDILRNVL